MGKLKDYQVKLHVNPNVPPVAQPVRCTPFSLHNKVKKKVEELVSMDIIEPVNGPTPWDQSKNATPYLTWMKYSKASTKAQCLASLI